MCVYEITFMGPSTRAALFHYGRSSLWPHMVKKFHILGIGDLSDNVSETLSTGAKTGPVKIKKSFVYKITHFLNILQENLLIIIQVYK